jgi:hypothetical protein
VADQNADAVDGTDSALGVDTPEAEPTSSGGLIVLSDEAQTALAAELKACMAEDKFARRSEVRAAALQRFYERGDQYIYWDSTKLTFLPAEESGEELPEYTEVFNIYRPHSRSLQSVLSQNPPGVNSIPDDLQQPADVTRANRAEKMRHRVDRDANMKAVQGKVARLFMTDARVVVRSDVVDGKAVVTAHGVLESKVPITASDICEMGYVVLSRERDLNMAKDEFKPIADKLTAGEAQTVDGSYERIARIGVLQGTKFFAGGDAEKTIVTEHTAWMRAARYRNLPDAVRDEVKAAAPNGLRLVVISGVVAEVFDQGMDDALTIGFPSEGDGQNRPSLLKDLVPLCDAFNDGMNMARSFFDYGIPAVWFNKNAVDSEAIADQRSEPAAFHEVDAPMGTPLSQVFFQEAAATLPAELMNFLENLQGQLSQFITGDLPSLYGGSMEDVDTAKGYSMAREQAMGSLSPAWASIQKIFAGVYKQAIQALADALGDEEISVESTGGKADKFPASELRTGNYGWYPDTDSSFPETTAAKRAAFQTTVSMLGSMPGGSDMIAQPDNLKLGLQLSGLEDFKVPGAEARDKQLREIERLLKGLPTPIDADFDYHQPELQKVQEWLSSEERVEADRAGETDGIERVRQHGLAHKQALAAQQAPPTGKPPAVAIAYKDVEDPAAKAQILAEAGIHSNAGAIVTHTNLAQAKDVQAEQIKKIPTEIK